MHQESPGGDESLAAALRALGMYYGAKEPLAATRGGTAEEAEAIRAYIRRERPHLLTCYDIETLVALVREARLQRAEPLPGLEQPSPAG